MTENDDESGLDTEDLLDGPSADADGGEPELYYSCVVEFVAEFLAPTYRPQRQRLREHRDGVGTRLVALRRGRPPTHRHVESLGTPPTSGHPC